jgi:type VI secretion system protein ImpK
VTPKFAKAIDPIFEATLQLESKIEEFIAGSMPINARDEQAILIEHIEHADRLLGKSRAWELSKYALCSWIDSRMIENLWKENKWWRNNSLEMRYFNSQVANQRFFEKASDAEILTDQDALEVFYLAVLLGFRGFYEEAPAIAAEKARRMELPDTIEKWAQKTAKRLRPRQQRPEVHNRSVVWGAKEPLHGKELLIQYCMITCILVALALACAVVTLGNF